MSSSIVNAVSRETWSVGTTGAGPYAGNVVVTLYPPGNSIGELVAVSFLLTTDATVVNRIVRVEYWQNGSAATVGVSGISCPASQLYIYGFGVGGAVSGNTDMHLYLSSIPAGLMCFGLWKAKVTVENGVAGDVLSVINSIWKIWPHVY